MAIYVPPHLIGKIEEEKPIINASREKKQPIETKKETIDNTKIITNSPYGAIDSFDSLKHIGSKSFITLIIIQRYFIPVLLNQHPLICRAPTGMGKTLCFLMPLIENLNHSIRNTICIIAPTRELCDQKASEALKVKPELRVATICGGRPYSKHYKPVDIVVASPGRLLDLLRSKLIDFSKVSDFVLDEADRLLDMGFERDIRSIKDFIPKTARCYLFSANYHENLKYIINDFLPEDRIKIEIEKETVESITQEFVETRNKDADLKAFLSGLSLCPVWAKNAKVNRVMIFVERKVDVDILENKINSWGIPVSALHGGKDQHCRTTILKQFKSNLVNVLVCTFVAARGIDIQGINYVINYDFPKDIKEYIHRIGRTGTQGKKGKAITYFLPNELSPELKNKLVKVIEEANNTVPDFLLKNFESGDNRGPRKYKNNKKDTSSTLKNMSNLNISESTSKFTKEKEDSAEDLPGMW